MSRSFPNGVGESLGDRLVVNEPLLVSAGIWHVDSTNPDASNASGYGITKNAPWATLVYAVSQANAGDMIVLHDWHDETLADPLEISSRLLIVGAGQSDGKPTVKLRLAATEGSGAGLLLSAEGTELRNIWFEDPTAAIGNFTNFVNVAASGCRIRGCYFEANEYNNLALIGIDTGLITYIENCTFVSTADDPADRPAGAITIAGGQLWMNGCVFDEGSVGWYTSSFPVVFETTAASTVVMENQTCIGGSRMLFTESSGQFIVSVTEASGPVEIIEQ